MGLADYRAGDHTDADSSLAYSKPRTFNFCSPVLEHHARTIGSQSMGLSRTCFAYFRQVNTRAGGRFRITPDADVAEKSAQESRLVKPPAEVSDLKLPAYWYCVMVPWATRQPPIWRMMNMRVRWSMPVRPKRTPPHPPSRRRAAPAGTANRSRCRAAESGEDHCRSRADDR